MPNQVILTRETRNFITKHDGTDICVGLLTGCPCCTCNMHQSWPKYIQYLLYASADNGLAAIVYAPCNVKAKVADGVEVQFEEQTNYPFDEDIKFVFSADKAVTFPLYLRVPGWCNAAKILVNGKTWESSIVKQIIKINRNWNSGDVVELNLPMEIRSSRWYENSILIIWILPEIYFLAERIYTLGLSV